MKETIINEKYKIIKKFKSSKKNERIYLAEEISSEQILVLKRVKAKELSLKDVKKIFDTTPTGNIAEGLKMKEFFLDEDFYMVFDYVKNETIKILKNYPSLGTILRNRYFISSGISSGQDSRIYLAADMKNKGKFFIVKEMDDDENNPGVARDYFKRAVSILSQINHPNIPEIKELFTKKESFYIIMEYIKGKNMSTYIETMEKDEFLEEEILMEWAIDICETLEHLHNLEIPIIYRNLTPDNIILTRDGILNFVDFAIARIYEDVKPPDKRYSYLTKGYAAPEAWDGKSEYRSDIYSFGATMFHIITKVKPEEVYPNFPRPSRYNEFISQEFDEIIMKALKLEKEDRYSSIEEIKELILELKEAPEVIIEEEEELVDEKEIYQRAKELRKAGELESALPLYKKVLEINPEKKTAHYGLALCYDEMGLIEDALEQFRIYRDSITNLRKRDKIEKKIKKLDNEFKEEIDRLDSIRRNREAKYRTYLEVKWVGGVCEIPAIEQVRKRLKIDEERALIIEEQVRKKIEDNIEYEKEIEEELKKTMEEKSEEIKSKSWDEESSSEEADSRLRSYYMTVKMAWEKGDVDEHDSSYFEKMRLANGISREVALKIEKDVKEKFSEKIKSAKEEWLKEKKQGEAAIEEEDLAMTFPESYRRVLRGPDLVEVRQAEIEEAKRREEESKKLLEQELTRKEEGIKKYRDEVRSLWNTSDLTQALYDRLKTQRALLGISDQDAMEIEREFEKKRKELQDLEERAQEATEKTLSEEEKEQKAKELISLKIEGFLKKGVEDENKSSLIMREFHDSGLKDIRAFVVLASGVGQYEDISENVSSIATKEFSKALNENKDNFTLNPIEARNLFEETIKETLYQVFYKAYKDKISTLSINLISIIILHNHYLIGTFGNMLAYAVTEKKARLLTREHDTVQLSHGALKELIMDKEQIAPVIFPMYMDNLFDVIPGEILFLCDKNFVDVIGFDEIKRQIIEEEVLRDSCEGLINLAYFIKEGSQDVVMAAIETGKLKRTSSTSIIQFDGSDESADDEGKTFLGKIKRFFKK